jgi:hypothetical protein
MKIICIFWVKNVFKKSGKNKFKKIKCRDPSLGHIQLILRSKLFIAVNSMLVCDLKV